MPDSWGFISNGPLLNLSWLLPKAPILTPFASTKFLSLVRFIKCFDTDECYGLLISIYVPGPGFWTLGAFLLQSLSAPAPKGGQFSAFNIFALISSFFFLSLWYFPGPGF